MINLKFAKASVPLRLSVLSLEDLKPHEGIIPRELEKISQDMKRTGFQRDPILIDRNSKVVLDGMHRRAALEKLRVKYALCAEFDYLGNEVKLERWLRYVIAPSDSLLVDVSKLFDLEPSKSSRTAIRQVDKGKSGMALLSREDSLSSIESKTPIGPARIHEIYEKINKFDLLCSGAGVEIGFVGESEKERLYSSKSVYVLYPAPLGKREILDFANKGRVLPYKTTRHIVPIRPMGVYFPLDDLKNSSLESCNEILEEIVGLSTIRLEKRDVWYEGRRYGEPLAVFRRRKG